MAARKFRLLVPKWAIGSIGAIRFMGGLTGGAMMDAGCYCTHVSRTLAAAALALPLQPPVAGQKGDIATRPVQLHVTAAAAKLLPGSNSVDGDMAVDWSTAEPRGSARTTIDSGTGSAGSTGGTGVTDGTGAKLSSSSIVDDTDRSGKDQRRPWLRLPSWPWAQQAPLAPVISSTQGGAGLSHPIAPEGVISGRIHASLQYEGLLPVNEITVTGTRGMLQCKGFLVPFFGHVIHTSVNPEEVPSQEQEEARRPFRNRQRSYTERVYGSGETTYYYQLKRFVEDLQALRDGSYPGRVQEVLQRDADDSIANMRFVDAAYNAAGLRPRQPAPPT